MTTAIDFNQFSSVELKAMRKEIDKAIEKKERAEIIEVRAKVMELVNNHGFTLEQVTQLSAAQPKIKLCHPSDPKLYWYGRGMKPKWLIAYLDGGGTMDQLVKVEC